MTELKQIDLTAKSFKANGKEYFIESGLSFERYRMYQMLQIECGYDVSFSGFFDKLKQGVELLNKLKLVEGSAILYNMLQGISRIEERKVPVLNMCALFINEANENRKVITNDMVDKKIADWEAEGLDIRPFFQLAVSSMANFVNAWKEVSQSILEADEIKK